MNRDLFNQVVVFIIHVCITFQLVTFLRRICPKVSYYIPDGCRVLSASAGYGDVVEIYFSASLDEDIIWQSAISKDKLRMLNVLF